MQLPLLQTVDRRSRQRDAHSKRQHDADIANKDNRGPLFEDSFQVNFKTDHKHEK